MVDVPKTRSKPCMLSKCVAKDYTCACVTFYISVQESEGKHSKMCTQVREQMTHEKIMKYENTYFGKKVGTWKLPKFVRTRLHL